MRTIVFAAAGLMASLAAARAKPPNTVQPISMSVNPTTTTVADLAPAASPSSGFLASGCIGNDETQYIQFKDTSETLYGMFIYADGNVREIHPGAPTDKCAVLSEGKDQYNCIECGFEMKGMEVMKKGSCWLTLLPQPDSGMPFDEFRGHDDGYTEFGKPGYPNTIKCYLDEVERRDERLGINGTVVEATLAEAEETVRPLGCVGKDNTQHVKWHSGTELYEMFVPRDGKKYDVIVPSTNHMHDQSKQTGISCIATSTKGAPCTLCSEQMDHVQIMSPGSCTWHATTVLGSDSGKRYDYTVTYSDGLAFIGTASYPLSVSCDA